MRPVEKVPAKVIVKLSQKAPLHSGHFQPVLKPPLGVAPMSKFTSIKSQAGTLLQKNERENKNCLFYLKNAFFKKIISFSIY